MFCVPTLKRIACVRACNTVFVFVFCPHQGCFLFGSWLQVALEGEISAKTVRATLRQGIKQAGDLIPWTMCQQVCACACMPRMLAHAPNRLLSSPMSPLFFFLFSVRSTKMTTLDSCLEHALFALPPTPTIKGWATASEPLSSSRPFMTTSSSSMFMCLCAVFWFCTPRRSTHGALLLLLTFFVFDFYADCSSQPI